MDAMETTARKDLERSLANYGDGTRYHMFHALAIVAVGLSAGASTTTVRSAAGWSFLLGTLAFSGSLYGIALGGPKWLGMVVTPTGGVLFIVGWILLAASAAPPAKPRSRDFRSRSPPFRLISSETSVAGGRDLHRISANTEGAMRARTRIVQVVAGTMTLVLVTFAAVLLPGGARSASRAQEEPEAGPDRQSAASSRSYRPSRPRPAIRPGR